MKQEEKVLTLMCRDKTHYFIPPDFMQDGLGELFVGYEASARLSGLDRKYPGLFITIKLDKYMRRKINWAKESEWYPLLPDNLKKVIEINR